MRKEMSLIAAHAAWHMGQWDEMVIYVDTVDSGPGGSSSSGSGMGGLSTSSSYHLAHHGSAGNAAASIMAAAAAAAASGRSSGGGSYGAHVSGMNRHIISSSIASVAGRGRLLSGSGDGMRVAAVGGVAGAAAAGVVAGGPMSSTGAFLRAVLCIKHKQHDLARFNIERARGEDLHFQVLRFRQSYQDAVL
jgi:hypothetical protein